MIIEILFVVVMLLWGLALFPQSAPYAAARPFLIWVAVLLLGLAIYAPGIGGGRVGTLRGLIEQVILQWA